MEAVRCSLADQCVPYPNARSEGVMLAAVALVARAAPAWRASRVDPVIEQGPT